jgi:hypothetical protein
MGRQGRGVTTVSKKPHRTKIFVQVHQTEYNLLEKPVSSRTHSLLGSFCGYLNGGPSVTLLPAPPTASAAGRCIRPP